MNCCNANGQCTRGTSALLGEMALYPVAEVKRLYATISSLQEQLDAAGISAALGSADVVLLRALGDSTMTRLQLATASGMSPRYLHTRMHRLRAMGYIEPLDQPIGRPPIASGRRGWLWRRTVRRLPGESA